MAAETYRIEIPVTVEDNTEPGVSQAQKKVDGFERSAKKTEERLNKMSREKFRVVLEALDRVSGVVGSVKARVKSLAGKAYQVTIKAVDMATRPIRSILSRLKSAAGMLGLGVGVAGGIVVPIKMVIQQQNVETAFEVLLGSAAKAKKRVEELTTFAGNTPYTRDEIYESSRILQVFTGNALSTGKGLTMVGDIAAGTKQSFSDVALWVGRMYDAMKSGNPIGEMTARLQEMGAINGESRLRLEELADSGKSISETWPEATKEFQRFDGMMEKMSGNLSNLLLGVKSFFNNNILKRIGNGLASGITPFLQKFRDWRKENSDLIAEMGDNIERGVGELSTKAINKVTDMVKKIKGLYNDPAFKKADFFGKVKIAWDKIVAEPFSEWWNTTGREWITTKAQSIGEGIGSGLTTGLLALLGIDLQGAKDDGVNIGSAFIRGFKSKFKTEEITAALKNWAGDNKGIVAGLGVVLGGKLIAGIVKGVKKGKHLYDSIAELFGGKGSKKTLPDGSGSPSVNKVPSTFTTDTMNVKAAVVNVYGNDIKNGTKSTGPSIAPVYNPLTSLFGGSGTGTSLPPGTGTLIKGLLKGGTTGGAAGAGNVVSTMLPNGVIVSGAGGALTEGLATIGTSLGSGAATMGGAAAIGGGSILGIIGGLLGIGAGAVDIYQGTQKTGKEAQDEYWQGGTKVGMVATGAGIGAGVGALFGGVGAVPGALIGAGVGGVASLFTGDGIGKWLSDATDEGGWLNETGKAISGFFTKTLPDKWNQFWGGVGNFFTDTIPSWWGDLTDKVGEFFTETIPEKWGEFWDGVGEFFSTDIPYAIGYTAGTIETFFTEDVPQFFSDLWDGIVTFFTETLPTWASDTWNNNIVPFFTETIPDFFSGLWDGIVTFFTESLPNWVSDTWNNHIVPFFTNIIPDWLEDVWNSLGSFFTETLPNFASTIWNAVVGFFTETIPNWIGSIFSSAGEGYSDAKQGKEYKPHAWGGILTRPHLGLVAEDGAESIIPLNPSKRARGIDLWQQTGQRLGVVPYANGGIVGETTDSIDFPTSISSMGAPVINIYLTLNPEFIIERNSNLNEEQIVLLLKSKIREMVDEISDEMAERIARIFANMPLKGGSVA